jgi:hypothetical protein
LHVLFTEISPVQAISEMYSRLGQRCLGDRRQVRELAVIESMEPFGDVCCRGSRTRANLLAGPERLADRAGKKQPDNLVVEQHTALIRDDFLFTRPSSHAAKQPHATCQTGSGQFADENERMLQFLHSSWTSQV